MTTRLEVAQSVPTSIATAFADPMLVRPGAVPGREPASTPTELSHAFRRHRAVEAMIWGMPAVNFDLMYQAMLRETSARANQMLYWSRPLDWKNQTLTPNTDVIYLTPFVDTKVAGPMVLEIPAADDGVINGTIMDAWQMPLEDVGPAGADAGKGGSYLILPPGYAGTVPDGYIVLPSLTYKGYAVLRSILRSGSEADIAKAVTYGRRIRLYPLVQAESPPPTSYVDAAGVLYDATIPYDARFYESLDRVVQYEPWLQRDRVMIDALRTIGIEKGEPFAPDAGARKALDEAAGEAHAWLESRFEALFTTSFSDGSRWAFPASPDFVTAVQSHYADPDCYPIDDRGLLFTYIFFSPKRLGEGQFYLMTIVDRAGKALDGGRNYRLKVPANAPVRQYWSATAYDRATHALIRDVAHAGRSSQSPGLQESKDGSVELYFGPTAPAGKEPNWIQTRPDGTFEVLFRFYGPEKPLFEKTWVLPDIDEVA